MGIEAATFVVPKSILCMRSDYFRALFEGGFKETQSRTADLPDVKPKLFALVLCWFFTGHVLFSDKSNYVTVNDGKTFDEAVQMFLFADQYGTRKLRLDIFDVFACGKARYDCGLETIPIAKALSQLPENSGLYRFFEDLVIYNWDPKELEECTEIVLYLPPTVLGKLLFKGLQPYSLRSNKAPYNTDMCQYHEHLDETERDNCAEVLKAKTRKLKHMFEAQERLSKTKHTVMP